MSNYKLTELDLDKRDKRKFKGEIKSKVKRTKLKCTKGKRDKSLKIRANRRKAKGKR